MIQTQCQRCLGLEETHSSSCIVRTVLFGETSIRPRATAQQAMDAAVLAVQSFLKGKDMTTSAKRDCSLNLEKLKEPFSEGEVEFRLSQSGQTRDGKIWAQCLAYITSRAIMDRLDSVCGPENWKVSYSFVGEKGVICNLSILINDKWITKQDGAEMTNIESFKGGISSALKRAGSAWGMGRYLYSLEATFAEIVPNRVPGSQYGKLKNGDTFFWIPPRLPTWALPGKTHEKVIQSLPEPQTVPVAKPVPKPSAAQMNRLYSIAKSKGLNQADLLAVMSVIGGVLNFDDLPMDQYYPVCNSLLSGQYLEILKPKQVQQIARLN